MWITSAGNNFFCTLSTSSCCCFEVMNVLGGELSQVFSCMADIVIDTKQKSCFMISLQQPGGTVWGGLGSISDKPGKLFKTSPCLFPFLEVTTKFKKAYKRWLNTPWTYVQLVFMSQATSKQSTPICPRQPSRRVTKVADLLNEEQSYPDYATSKLVSFTLTFLLRLILYNC